MASFGIPIFQEVGITVHIATESICGANCRFLHQGENFCFLFSCKLSVFEEMERIEYRRYSGCIKKFKE